MKQFVTYRRVSTEDQGRSGLGQDAQALDIRLFLETFAEEPHEVIGEFVEVQSGKDDARPELMKALEMVRRTGAELLVAKLDRLSRRVSFIASLMEDPKVRLRVAAMPRADKFQLHIYAAIAEQERDFISARTKAALAAAKAKGKKLGGLRPSTWKLNETRRAGARDRAQRIAGVVEPMRARGSTLREIAEGLDKAGVPTARGGRWTAMQVKRVLDRLEDGRAGAGAA